ncbi:MAG: hypothetical protein O4750_01230, partial [Trichodesmium sp. St18_bin3_1_1]|nr:hypothetical protein [Trichodesmium sp. St18_bin3_1_1]
MSNSFQRAVSLKSYHRVPLAAKNSSRINPMLPDLILNLSKDSQAFTIILIIKNFAILRLSIFKDYLL